VSTADSATAARGRDCNGPRTEIFSSIRRLPGPLHCRRGGQCQLTPGMIAGALAEGRRVAGTAVPTTASMLRTGRITRVSPARRRTVRQSQPKSLASKQKFHELDQLDHGRHRPRRNFPISFLPNSCIWSFVPPPSEGRFAIVTDVGGGMRWTLWRARRARSKRTAKPCGPGAPTLASSPAEDDLRGDGGKKARSPRRARYKR